MPTFVMRNGVLVDKNYAPPLHGGDNATNVISDEMPETRHMCDNQLYTSKAKFRETTRAYGCVEVGNETDTLLKPRKRIELDRRKRADDIRRVIYELKNSRRYR